jgi:hypothetical protein
MNGRGCRYPCGGESRLGEQGGEEHRITTGMCRADQFLRVCTGSRIKA